MGIVYLLIIGYLIYYYDRKKIFTGTQNIIRFVVKRTGIINGLFGIVGLLFTSCSAINSRDNSSNLGVAEKDSVKAPFLMDAIKPLHDFISVIDGDSVYFNILDDSAHVSLVYWSRNNFDNHVIHIPSIVKNDKKEYQVSEIYAEAMGVEFYGDREGKSIWTSDHHLVDSIYIPSSVKEIHGSAFTARFRSKNLHIVLSDSLEYLGPAAVNCMDIKDENDAVILPKNIVCVEWLFDDEDHGIPDFKYSKLFIPEHVEFIGGLDNFERNQPLFKRVEVHPRNKHFRTIDGVLFNYALTELYWSTVNENLYIPKNVCVDKAKLSELEDGWYSHLQLPEFKTIRTEAGNPYCIAIDDVLYDIKNRSMIMSTTNPRRVAHVPEWCNSVYLLESYNNIPTKYVFSDKASQHDVESFIEALKTYIYDEDTTTFTFSYKGKTWTSKQP